MDDEGQSVNLISLPAELIFGIVYYLDRSSFYSLHNVCYSLFEILSRENLRKVRYARTKAKTDTKQYKKSAEYRNLSSREKSKFRQFFYLHAYNDLVEGTLYDRVCLDVRMLSNIEIRRLIDFYKKRFQYNLIYYPLSPFGRPVSVILTFNFLKSFYKKSSCNFKIILFTLKTLGYEAPVNFRSIHEIRSIGFEGERLDEEFFLENYEGQNPSFVSKYETLRRYTSELVLRSKLVFI